MTLSTTESDIQHEAPRGDHDSHAEPLLPRPPRTVFASVFMPVWGSSFLLALCFCLPLCFVGGCQSTPPKPYYPCAKYIETDSVAELFGYQVFDWYYLFGLITGAGTLLIAATGKVQHFRTLWITYAAAIGVIVLAMLLSAGREYRQLEHNGDSPPLMSLLWVLVPTVFFLSLLVLTYFNCRTWLRAALCVQLTLAILSLAWFLFLRFGFEFPWAFGGRLSVVACGLLIVATCCEWRYGLKALGISQPPTRRRRQLSRSC
jgi:hypothetical protein